MSKSQSEAVSGDILKEEYEASPQTGIIEGDIIQEQIVGGEFSTPSDFTADKHYAHRQFTAASVWNVAHNLNKYPAVSVVDSAGTVVVGEVTYLDENNLTITFTSAFAGKAYCN